MANMLPQEEQRRLRREYLGRFGVVALSSFLLVGIVVNIALVPALIVAQQKARTLKNAADLLEESTKQFGGEDLSVTLEETKQKMAMISMRTVPHTAHEAFFTVAKDREAGVAITALSYTREGMGTSTMSVTGIAATREGLIAFTKRLEGEKIFASVHLPIANLTLDKDIDFSLSVTGVF